MATPQPPQQPDPAQSPPAGQYPPPGGQYPPPGQPQPPGPYPPPGQQAPFAAGTPAPAKRKTFQRIAGVLVLLVVAVLMVVGFFASRSSPDLAKVGDCVARSGSDDIKIVKCTDAAAAYKVVGKVDNKTQAQFTVNGGQICKAFAGAESGYWKGKVGEPGYVLCLAPAK